MVFGGVRPVGERLKSVEIEADVVVVCVGVRRRVPYVDTTPCIKWYSHSTFFLSSHRDFYQW